MGLLNGNFKKSKGFVPKELTETNVDILYNNSLANEEEIKERKDLVLAQCFIKKYTGEDSRLSVFSRKKLEERKQKIEYLLGQVSHGLIDFCDFDEASYNYKNEEWTEKFTPKVKLFDMGIALNILTPVTRAGTSLSYRIRTDLPKTLSPKDPDFPEWYKGYQRDVLKEEPKEPEEK